MISRWGKTTIATETGFELDYIKKLAAHYYEEDNLSAAISSGSFRHDGMIIAPCSMKTLSAIAGSYTDNLITRAADVTLKERRRLVLMTRETPLSPLHLENMLKLANLGVTIMPPVPAFYLKPETIDDLVNQTVGRCLQQFGLEIPSLRQWRGDTV